MQFPLTLISGHLILEIEGQKVLVDTGAPSSVGRASRWSFLGREHPLTRDYLGVTPAVLSELVGTHIDLLLGADILGQFPFVVDTRRNSITFCLAEPQPTGIELPLTFLRGIPIVTVTYGEQARSAFLDTGAMLSYIRRESARSYTQLREESDFYPGIGRFRTPVYRVPVEFGSEALPLTCGVLPEPLEMSLLTANAQGIIGTEIFETFLVYFSMPTSRVVLSRHAA